MLLFYYSINTLSLIQIEIKSLIEFTSGLKWNKLIFYFPFFKDFLLGPELQAKLLRQVKSLIFQMHMQMKDLIVPLIKLLDTIQNQSCACLSLFDPL